MVLTVIRYVAVWDWAEVSSPGARLENLVACALLKSVHFWTDHGFGDYSLHFVRDKDKREVDFLVARNNQPWLLVEVKSGDRTLSPALRRFQEQTGALHAFQAVADMDFAKIDCFSLRRPAVVPLSTLLSQLV